MIDYPELAEARRPGITKLCERVQHEHPDWGRAQCVAEAKIRYHTPIIAKSDGDVMVEVINPDYLAGRDR